MFFLNKNRRMPNGSNQTILRQRTSIAMMLPRCQASAWGGRREGEQTIQCLSFVSVYYSK